MSTLFTSFDPSTVVETIEVGRTYPKKAVISYLTCEPICKCFRDADGGRLKECDELTVLVEHYGLIPLGDAKRQRFRGDNLLEAEWNRSIDHRVPQRQKRLSIEKLNDESVGPPKSRRGQKEGKE